MLGLKALTLSVFSQILANALKTSSCIKTLTIIYYYKALCKIVMKFELTNFQGSQPAATIPILAISWNKDVDASSGAQISNHLVQGPNKKQEEWWCLFFL